MHIQCQFTSNDNLKNIPDGQGTVAGSIYSTKAVVGLLTSMLSKAFIVAITLLTFAIATTPAVHAQEKSLFWERFDVDIVVNADGSFDVSEHQTIQFTNGTFRFGTRDIPISKFRYIDNWSMTDSQGNLYQPASGGEEAYTFQVQENGSQYLIKWFFPPTANSAETYTLSYKVHGGLRYYDGGDQLWWKAIYPNRSFPVYDGLIRVTVPNDAQIQEWAAYIAEEDAQDYATATVADGSRDIVFDVDSRLDSGEDFEVRVQFTAGVVAGMAEPWQAQADAEAAAREEERAFQEQWGAVAGLGFGGLGLLTFLGGPAALYALWYRRGRDKPVEMVADYIPEPPDSLPPGMVGTLLDETVDMEDIIATLVDLARRKAISITESREETMLSYKTDFIYRKERNDVELRPYEKQLLKAIFGRKDETSLSDLKNKFYTKMPEIKSGMYEAAVTENLFPKNPDSVRSQYGFLGMVFLAIAVGLGFLLLTSFGDLTTAAILPAFGLGVTALCLLILARVMPRKTDHGAEVAARWSAFKMYLKNIDKYADMEAQKPLWDRYLPYAIAFGIDKEYMRKFEKVDAPAPGWYIPEPDMYGPYRRRYYGMPYGYGGYGVPGMGNGGSGESSMPQEGGGSSDMGGDLSDMSRGMGSSLAGMSAGLGSMLSSAGSTFTSRPAETSSSSGGGWSGSGGGFSGGGSFGGGGGGGGGGDFG